jgi:hypothetical protein
MKLIDQPKIENRIFQQKLGQPTLLISTDDEKGDISQRNVKKQN